MVLFGWLLLLGGLFGLLATRLGWHDRGGVLRRLDILNVYRLFERPRIDRDVRWATYAISATLVALGILEILLSLLQRS